MDRHKKRKRVDTAVLALAIAVPITVAAVTGCFAPFIDSFQRLLKFTAAASMPEAGIQSEIESALSPSPVATHPDQSLDLYEIQPDTSLGDTVPRENFITDPAADKAAAEALIPEENRGPIEETQYLSKGSGDNYINYGNASIRNATNYSNAELAEAIAAPLSFDIELNSPEPQVLIVHTHSTESYDRFDAGFYDTTYPYRSTDSALNVVAVGETMTAELNALGINTVHACEYHDYPSYNNSYSRSRETILSYLEQYPSIKIVIDLHRDGIETEAGTRIKPTAVIDGHKASQIMIVSGAGDDWDDVPEFKKNLAFAAELQDTLQTLYPGLARPVYFAYRHYNQDLTPGSILIEFGSHANTLNEAKYAAMLVARALAEMWK